MSSYLGGSLREMSSVNHKQTLSNKNPSEAEVSPQALNLIYPLP